MLEYYGMRGADRSLVMVFFSRTPLRIDCSMVSPSSTSPSCPSQAADSGGLVDACPLHDSSGRTDSGSMSLFGSTSSLGSIPAKSGTVGVMTGMTGVWIGTGPVPLRTEGLVEGVRRMVATPGTTGTEGMPAVEAGRLVWNSLR